MDKVQDIRNAVKKLASDGEEFYGIPGTVKDVDDASRTCTVAPLDYPGAVLKKVRIAGASTGVYLKPTVGSQVVVVPINRYTGVIVMWSALDSIAIDNNQIAFNGGNNGGLINIEALVTKINAIETALNNLVSEYNAHVHSGGTISGSTGTPVVPSTIDISPETARADIEDTAITH